jgi:hypothetical protein
VSGWLSILGGAVTVVGVIVTGWLTYKGTRTAAAIAAGPAEKQNEFTVLQATVSRVDEENKELRKRQSRTDAVLRAFARSADRWCRQMTRAGIEPEPADPLVDEYNRTGV